MWAHIFKKSTSELTWTFSLSWGWRRRWPSTPSSSTPSSCPSSPASSDPSGVSLPAASSARSRLRWEIDTVLIGCYDYHGTNHKDIIVIRQWGLFWVNWRCDGLSETWSAFFQKNNSRFTRVITVHKSNFRLRKMYFHDSHFPLLKSRFTNHILQYSAKRWRLG